MYPFLPGIFLAIAVATLPVYYLNRRWFGNNFAAHLETKLQGFTNRESYRLFRPIALGVGITFSILNFLAYDCYLIVDRKALRYSPFFLVTHHRVSISKIVSGTKCERRRAPNGRINHKPYLKLNLRDGSAADTFYLIEPQHIGALLQAIEQARREFLCVMHQRGP